MEAGASEGTQGPSSLMIGYHLLGLCRIPTCTDAVSMLYCMLTLVQVKANRIVVPSRISGLSLALYQAYACSCVERIRNHAHIVAPGRQQHGKRASIAPCSSSRRGLSNVVWNHRVPCPTFKNAPVTSQEPKNVSRLRYRGISKLLDIIL